MVSVSSNNNLGAAGAKAQIENGATLRITGSDTVDRPFFIRGNASIDVSSSQPTTISGVIADDATSGTLNKTDTGTLILTGANTYTPMRPPASPSWARR